MTAAPACLYRYLCLRVLVRVFACCCFVFVCLTAALASPGAGRHPADGDGILVQRQQRLHRQPVRHRSHRRISRSEQNRNGRGRDGMRRTRQRNGNGTGTERERNGNGTGTARERNGNGTGTARERHGNGTGTERERNGNGTGTEQEWEEQYDTERYGKEETRRD